MWICAKTELQPSTDEAQKAAARALEDHGGGLQGPDGTTEVVPAQGNGPLLKIPGGPHHQKHGYERADEGAQPDYEDPQMAQ